MNSLTELKKTILSLNETITDDDITVFQKQLSQLGQENKENPIVITFLKMMRSIGGYLGAKKNKAHADSIPALHSIGEQLENVITTPDLENDEAQRILSEGIRTFTSLKNKLGSRPSIPDNDINDLKAVILAIDWEISDTTLENFENVTSLLLVNLKNYKIHHTFLKIIHSIGRFIGRQKANAPTDSISFLRSVFENFEQIVQTPDMTFKDKKHLLEIDINRFHEFKQRISQKPAPTGSSIEPSEDESIQPALSHIKHANMPTTSEVMTLTTLSESEDVRTSDTTDPGTMAPALTGKKGLPAEPKDIMDDIFSTKESPADELLDAIHLQEVHGPNQGPAGDVLSDGMKNLTPGRMDNEPIAEIGDRLDEFFNLDSPADRPVEIDVTDAQITETDTITDTQTADGIIPFQNTDESLTKDLPQLPDNATAPLSSDIEILGRLADAVKTSERLQSESALESIARDISFLEDQWENDPDKTRLLQIISRLITVLKNTDREGETSQKDSLGLLGKIKAKFTP